MSNDLTVTFAGWAGAAGGAWAGGIYGGRVGGTLGMLGGAPGRTRANPAGLAEGPWP